MSGETRPLRLSTESRCGRECGCILHFEPDMSGAMTMSLGYGVVVENIDEDVVLARLDNKGLVTVRPGAYIAIQGPDGNVYETVDEQEQLRWLEAHRPPFEEIL